MPISNPIVNLINNPPTPLPMVLVENTDPLFTPTRDRIFWLNSTSNRLWVSKAANSVNDWVQVGNTGNTGGSDIATIVGAILVADNAVLTDGFNVIFED